MNPVSIISIVLLHSQATTHITAHDLTGTWVSHGKIADSTWTFGPNNRFIGEGRTVHDGKVFIFHSDGNYIVKGDVIHVKSRNEWTIKGSVKTTLQAKDFDSTIAWMNSLQFKSDLGLIFRKQLPASPKPKGHAN